ncbi:hypothetical protein [Thiolapillus sp.]|uniref:hypothetical protein n=1 Tax=Thiolapillus sp. TaxID=2017437 RepID=UPI003AF87781
MNYRFIPSMEGNSALAVSTIFRRHWRIPAESGGSGYVSDSSSFFFLFLIVKFSPAYVRGVISDAFIQLLDEATGIAAD